MTPVAAVRRDTVDPEPQEEVYRGHFEECLQHLASRLEEIAPSGSRGVQSFRKPIIDFCGMSNRGVQRWLMGQRKPLGAARIKLECYLDSIGYKIIELERMEKSRRFIHALIGYGIVAAEKIQELLGYAALDTVFKAIDGRIGYTTDKKEKFWALYMSNREALEAKQLEVQKSRIPFPKPVPRIELIQKRVGSKEGSDSTKKLVDDLVGSFRALLEHLLAGKDL